MKFSNTIKTVLKIYKNRNSVWFGTWLSMAFHFVNRLNRTSWPPGFLCEEACWSVLLSQRTSAGIEESFCSSWLIKQPLPAWIARLHWHVLCTWERTSPARLILRWYLNHHISNLVWYQCLMILLSLAAFKTVAVIFLVCQIVDVIWQQLHVSLYYEIYFVPSFFFFLHKENSLQLNIALALCL